mgnify:CR=1 FL=1
MNEILERLYGYSKFGIKLGLENMKKLMTFRSLSECDQARLLLEGSGIACSMRNEFAANTAAVGPRGPLSFTQPDLCILDESREQDALEILNHRRKQ